MVNKCKVTNRKKVVTEGHYARPVMSINPPINSRFAYKLKANKKSKEVKGIWALDGFNVSKREFTYREVKC